MKLEFESLHLLGIVRMFGTCVDLEFFENLATETIVGNHSANGALNEKLGTA